MYLSTPQPIEHGNHSSDVKDRTHKVYPIFNPTNAAIANNPVLPAKVQTTTLYNKMLKAQDNYTSSKNRDPQEAKHSGEGGSSSPTGNGYTSPASEGKSENWINLIKPIRNVCF